MDVVFHVAFAANEPFRLPVARAPSRWERFRGGEPVEPARRAEPEQWMLPLYPYPPKLERNVRSWLPHSLLDWDEPAPHADIERLEGVTLGHSNVSLWEPDLVMVTQEVTIAWDGAEGGLDAANTEVNRVSAWLSGTQGKDDPLESPLKPLVGRAFGDDSDDVVVGQLKQHGVDHHPLWAWATVCPGWGSASEGTVKGPLKLWEKEFACFVSYAGEEDRDELERFLLLMGIQNVVWHAAIQYDGKLVGHITDLHPGPDDEHPRRKRRRPLEQVERQGEALLSVSFDVKQLHGRVASLKTHLEQGEVQGYWGYMNQAWGLTDYIDSIARKADDLIGLHDRVVTQKTSRRARRLANAAMFFTALGLVSLAVAIEEFVYDKPDSGLIAALVAIGAVSLLWVAYLWRKE